MIPRKAFLYWLDNDTSSVLYTSVTSSWQSNHAIYTEWLSILFTLDIILSDVLSLYLCKSLF